MAVVEVGWTVRAGYIGDAKCTRRFPSIRCAEVPTETNFPSILMAADKTGGDSIQQLWTPGFLEGHMEDHVAQLDHIMGSELQCSGEFPLMLVLPEMWHERFDLVRALFFSVLESGFTPAMYCFRPSVAWTLASGRTSAVVLDVGHSHATVAAVLDGYTLRGSIASTDVAGSAVTRYMIGMLPEENLRTLESVRRHRFVSEWALNDVTDKIKCMACSVQSGRSLSCKEEALVLRAPDGSLIRVPAAARTQPYELLFSSTPDAKGSGTLADLLVLCKRGLDPEWQQLTVPHIICGGTSQAPGFCRRLLKEAQERDSSYFRYEKDGVFRLTTAVDGAWIGASLAADSSSFASLWVTRADLEEEGESVLYRRLHY